jgi:hypothetical protein
MYKDIPLSTYSLMKGLKSAGHIIWLEDYLVPKKISEGSFGGKRPVGRPCNRWEDNVQKDAVPMLHIQNWKSTAQHRTGGRTLGRPWPKNGLKHHKRG